MQSIATSLGSRSWAAIVLLGGTLLALPFFRSQPASDSEDVLERKLEVDITGRSRWPKSLAENMPLPGTLAASELPSPVKPGSLPNWVADGPQPMQKLLSENVSSHHVADSDPIVHLPIQPLRSWIAEPTQPHPSEYLRSDWHKASDPHGASRASASSVWDENVSGSLVQTCPARAVPEAHSGRLEWPDQRISLQNSQPLVQEINPRRAPLGNRQLVESATGDTRPAPVQPASLERIDARADKPPTKSDKPRHFIFQPGMKR